MKRLWVQVVRRNTAAFQLARGYAADSAVCGAMCPEYTATARLIGHGLWTQRPEVTIMSRGTLVVQSFRTHDVPGWIGTCMNSVQRWAARNDFSYAVLGDEFLRIAPEWFREKAAEHITVVTDLARLELIGHCLRQGFARVVWCDADVLVCCPDEFRLSPLLSYAFSREVWVFVDEKGELCCSHKINNSICFFRPDSMQYLLGLIETSKRIVASVPRVLSNLIIGTALLTRLNLDKPLPVIQHTGLISPAVMGALAEGDVEMLARFRQWHREPLYAVNFCNFYRGIAIPDEVFSHVADRLIATHGAVLNDAGRYSAS